MRLYCMRHGEAEAGLIDNERALTDTGQKEAKRIGDYLAKLHAPLTYAYHSGYVRAEQTVDIVLSSLDTPIEPKLLPGLEGGSLVEPMAEMIQHWQDDTLIVSHMPFISDLVSYLVTGQRHQTLFSFPPAMLVIIERARPGVWQLVTALSPSMVV